MTTLRADILVIGWGKAGKTLAKRMSAGGKNVVLVERSPQMYGGTCINVACVPTKDLVVSAERKPADADPAHYFAESVRGRDALISKLNAANYGMLEGSVQIVDGTARFTGERTVAVETAEDELSIEAEHVIVGTGTTPAMPGIEGENLPGVYTSTTIQHADPFPQRLAIVGGGVIGLEFASMFQQFGAKVTLLNRAQSILAEAEDAVREEAIRILTSRGAEILNGAFVSRIEEADAGLRLTVATSNGEESAVEADAVLLATGRTPATADLALEAAGIETDERGYIVVDDHLRTSAPGVWAVGDVNGGPQFTYISLDDYRIVLDQLVGDGTRSRADRVAVPRTTFLTPPLSQVGVTPREAVTAGHSVLYAAKPVAKIAAMPRPKILGETDGVITVTADATTGAILGASLLCTDSQEVINLVALAIRMGATVEDLRDGIWTHPASTEAFNEVLAELAPFGESA